MNKSHFNDRVEISGIKYSQQALESIKKYVPESDIHLTKGVDSLVSVSRKVAAKKAGLGRIQEFEACSRRVKYFIMADSILLLKDGGIMAEAVRI